MPDRHDDKEIPLFRLFAPVCGLPIEPASIEKREPPEPDILCHVTGEGPVAFELIELVNEKKIARPTGDQEDLIDHLRDGYRSLSSATKAEFDRRFGNALVRAKFRPDLSLRRRKKIADDILEEMLKIDPSFEGTFGMNDGKMEVASVEVVRGNFAGPHFRVPAAASYNPIPLARLEAKFEKKYSSGAPIELLAYYDRQSAPLEKQLQELFNYIQARLAGSHFRRAWVFNVSDQRICFSVA
jgi:hypothetical protein